jgi:transcriptional antiterminator RfaH
MKVREDQSQTDIDQELLPASWRVKPSLISASDALLTISGSEALEQSSWYCLRCRRNQETLTGSLQRVLFGVPVFCPRIRFKRISGNTKMWVTEPLFPGYFFAKFDSASALAGALPAYGVFDVVKLGERYAVITDEAIRELKYQTRATETGSLGLALVPGERWRVLDNTGNGLEVVILQILSGRERVERLLEVLQRETVERLSDDESLLSITGGLNLLELVARVGLQSPRRGVRRSFKTRQSETAQLSSSLR